MSDDMLWDSSVMGTDDNLLSSTSGFAAGLWRNGSFALQRGALACQVEGCDADLSLESKAYCQKKRICSQHMRAECIIRTGDTQELWRFCFQCGKLEPLGNFDGPKRSCRARLERRKLPPKRSMTWTAGSTSSKSSSSSMTLHQQHQQQQQLIWELQQQNMLLEQQQHHHQVRMLQQYPGVAQGLGMASAQGLGAATPFAAAQLDRLDPACPVVVPTLPTLDRAGLMQQMLVLSEQKTRLQAMRATMGQYQGLNSASSIGPITPAGFPPLQVLVPNVGMDAGSPSPSQLQHLSQAGRKEPLHSVLGPGIMPGAGTFAHPALHPALSSSSAAAGHFACSAEQQLTAMQAQVSGQLQQHQAVVSAAGGIAGNPTWPCTGAMSAGFKSAPASKQSSLGGRSGSIADAMADLVGLEECDDFDVLTNPTNPNQPGLSVADVLTSEFAAAFPELELGMGDSHEATQQQQQPQPHPTSQHQRTQVEMLMQQAQFMQQQVQHTAAMGAGYVQDLSTGFPAMNPTGPLMAPILPCSSSAATAALGGVSSNLDPTPAAVSVRQQQGQLSNIRDTPGQQERQLQHLMQTVQVLQESIRELSMRVHGRDPPAPTSSPGTGSVGSYGGGSGV